MPKEIGDMVLLENLKKQKRNYLLKRDNQKFDKEYLKKSYLSYPPRQVTIGITSVCNNRCVFCAYNSSDAKEGNVYGMKYDLGLTDFQKMVDICYAGRVPKVHICSTGEPFFHRDILLMIDYVAEKYRKVSFQTNFCKSLFEKNNFLYEIVKRNEKITEVTTDILSGDPTTHNELKRGSSYYDVIDALAFLSQRTEILFNIHYIFTVFNYKYLQKLLIDLLRKKVNFALNVVNLHAYDFNKYTSTDAQYTTENKVMFNELNAVKDFALNEGVRISLPNPVDSKFNRCGSFWNRFQTWPVKGIDKSRYSENVIVGGCRAVVKGRLNTLGYFFDYSNIMELWNNEKFLLIRQGLIDNIYPDAECSKCQNYYRI